MMQQQPRELCGVSLWRLNFLVALFCLLTACSSVRTRPDEAVVSEKGYQITLMALSLIDTGYRFGGKNPEAGLDCSGMVSYVFNKAIGMQLAGSAASMARLGQEVDKSDLRPGDLVFFNTRNFSYSHVGIYIGNNRFIHAPSSGGKVRIDSLQARYYATHFEEARSYFD